MDFIAKWWIWYPLFKGIKLCLTFFFFFNAGLSSMCHTQLLSCFLAFILCMQRHPLTINGNASSTYIYTTHGTKLLKMPLFPIITYEQHRDMLWSHPHILVPLSTSVLHRMMYEYNFFGLFCLLFCWKNMDSVQNSIMQFTKRHNYWHTSTTRQNKNDERHSSISLVYVAG